MCVCLCVRVSKILPYLGGIKGRVVPKELATCRAPAIPASHRRSVQWRLGTHCCCHLAHAASLPPAVATPHLQRRIACCRALPSHFSAKMLAMSFGRGPDAAPFCRALRTCGSSQLPPAPTSAAMTGLPLLVPAALRPLTMHTRIEWCWTQAKYAGWRSSRAYGPCVWGA